MNNERELFEKLAVEHGMSVLKVADAYSNDDTNYAWWVWQKARATSNIKPVAWRWMWKTGGYRGDRDYLDWGYKDIEPKNDDDMKIVEPLFTHPPASVSLEKYNKLLDALRESLALNINWSSEAEPETLAYYSEYRPVIRLAQQAIAEAEGKEG